MLCYIILLLELFFTLCSWLAQLAQYYMFNFSNILCYMHNRSFAPFTSAPCTTCTVLHVQFSNILCYMHNKSFAPFTSAPCTTCTVLHVQLVQYRVRQALQTICSFYNCSMQHLFCGPFPLCPMHNLVKKCSCHCIICSNTPVTSASCLIGPAIQAHIRQLNYTIATCTVLNVQFGLSSYQ